MSLVRVAEEPPTEILIYTSKLILIPAILALGLRRWGDIFIITFQAVVSTWYHSQHTITSYYADQIGIWLLVVHTFLLARTSAATPYLFVLGFGYMLVVYSYGKRKKCFCFDPNRQIGDRYHASIHILGIAIYSASIMFFLPATALGLFDLKILTSIKQFTQ